MNNITRIINSLCDNDLYKFTQQCSVLHCFPRAMVKYEFDDRNNTKYPQGFAELVNEQVKKMEELAITDEEISYMRRFCYYLPDWYFTFLKGFRFNSNEVKAVQDEEGHLKIHIEGYWYSTILWEVPLLAIVSELKNIVGGFTDSMLDEKHEYEKAYLKGERLCKNGCVFSEFGTRRRSSFKNQDIVVKALADAATNMNSNCFAGTSNVYLAMKYALKPMGTMAHEWVSGIAAFFGPQMANYLAMEYWQKTYNGSLGIYLYDTFSWKPFALNFNGHYARVFDGLRVDSGIEEQQTVRIINKYYSLGVDPLTKTVLFSNALDVDRAIELNEFCKGRCKCAFGIGTHFTADIDDVPHSNIVIKLSEGKITEYNDWSPTCKISNDKGKVTKNPETVGLFKKLLQID